MDGYAVKRIGARTGGTGARRIIRLIQKIGPTSKEQRRLKKEGKV